MSRIDPGRERMRVLRLAVHLAWRELQSEHRFTYLRWLWPPVRQLAMLAVLVFVFSKILDLGIENFALFVFTGLLIWGWFSTAVSMATTSLVERRHLVHTPGFPLAAIPLAAVLVPLVDTLMTLPILLVVLALEVGLAPTALLTPLILLVVGVLTGGAALAVAALNVYFRDVRNAVAVGLLMLFYLTPIFFSLDLVPDEYVRFLELNPLTAVVTGARDALMYGTVPTAFDTAVAVGAAALSAALGLLVFKRLEPDFVDEL